MPTAPRRPCSRPGCRELQPCSTHKPHTRPEQSYAARRQAEPWRALYDTQAWKRLRLAKLAETPLCECDACKDSPKLATVVDHRLQHRGDIELFFDMRNLVSMAKRCHDRKTASEVLHGRR